MTAAAPRASEGDDSRSLLLKGAAWTLLSLGFTQALRLASNAVLWRLLSEEAFGLMAIITALMVGLHMFSDVGIGPASCSTSAATTPTSSTPPGRSR